MGWVSVHLHKFLEELKFIFLRKYFVPATKRIGADLVELAVAEISYEVCGGKIFKTAAKGAGNQILTKQLSSGSKKKKGATSEREFGYGRQASRFIPTKSAKQTSQSRRD